MWLSEQTATPAGLHFQAKQKLWSYDAAGSGAGGNAIDVFPTLDGVWNDVYPFARRCHKLCSRRYRSGVSWRGGRAFGEPEAGGEIKLAGCKHRKLRNLNMVPPILGQRLSELCSPLLNTDVPNLLGDLVQPRARAIFQVRRMLRQSLSGSPVSSRARVCSYTANTLTRMLFLRIVLSLD